MVIFLRSYQEILVTARNWSIYRCCDCFICFRLALCVVDGNVERVSGQILWNKYSDWIAAGKKLYNTHCRWNCWTKKILDFIIRPLWILEQQFVNHRNPLCSACVQAKNCQAFQNELDKQSATKKPVPIQRKEQMVLLFYRRRQEKTRYGFGREPKKISGKIFMNFFYWKLGK